MAAASCQSLNLTSTEPSLTSPVPLSSSSSSSSAFGERFSAANPKSLQTFRKGRIQSTIPISVRSKLSSDEDSVSFLKNSSFTLLSTSLIASSGPAYALTAEEITDGLLKIQEVTEKATGAIGNAYGTGKAFVDQFLTIVKPAFDAAAPYVKQAADAAFQIATPIASDVASQADNALRNAGVDTQTVVYAAKTAVELAGEAAEQTAKVIESAKPVASSTVDSIVSADPLFLAAGAGVVTLFYLLTPPLLSSISYSLRGYRGDLSAAQVLDFLSKSDFVLIDVRTEKEKSRSGLPSLPRNVKNKSLLIPIEELPPKVKGQLNNSRKVEAEIAALKISYLKRIGRGSNIILLDSSGEVAKSVAKSLSKLGFKNVWVVVDGFDGGRGWVQSRLGTESYNSILAEVTRIIPSGLKSSSTVEIVGARPRSNRLLPSGSED